MIAFFVSGWAIVFLLSEGAIVFFVSSWAIVFLSEWLGDRVFGGSVGDRVFMVGWAIAI